MSPTKYNEREMKMSCYCDYSGMIAQLRMAYFLDQFRNSPHCMPIGTPETHPCHRTDDSTRDGTNERGAPPKRHTPYGSS